MRDVDRREERRDSRGEERKELRGEEKREEKKEEQASTAPAATPSSLIQKPKLVIAREKTCPLLMRVFIRVGEHNREEDYNPRADKFPKDELQIYTWKDADLRELTSLIKEVNNLARKRDTQFSFAFVFPDKRGRMTLKPVGKTHSVKKGEDDDKNLDSLRFEPGDYLDVAILPSNAQQHNIP